MSKNFIVTKNVINIYAEPDTASEVTTQAILGARLTEQEHSGSFVRIIGEDRYSGWASSQFLAAEDEADTSAPQVVASKGLAVTDLFANIYSAPDENAELVSRLVISTRLACISKAAAQATAMSAGAEESSAESVPGASDTSGGEFSKFVNICMPGKISSWVKRSSTGSPPAVADISNWDKSPAQREVLIKMLGERVVTTAKRFIGVPYFWGGCTPFGIDCSGLTQLCYKIEGVQLLRDTYLQSDDRRFIEVEKGKTFDEAQFLPGDLLLFKTGNKQLGTGGDHGMHIGIACGGRRFIHASGRQRNFGVYINSCSEPFYFERYMKALRLSASASLSIDNA